jgi:hypothetical protein
MDDGNLKPCAGHKARAALLGAAAGLTLIWAGVIGHSLYRGQTDDAVIWLAVAVGSLTAIVLPLLDKCRGK